MIRVDDPGAERAARAWAAVVSIVFVAVLFVPVIRWEDGFPLSNYPMFSRPKDREARIYHVVGFSETGHHRPLTPEMVGTDEIMQAHVSVRLAIGRGPGAVADLCQRAARAVAAEPSWSDVSLVEVRVDWFDAIDYWQGARKPVRSRIAGRCPVQRERS